MSLLIFSFYFDCFPFGMSVGVECICDYSQKLCFFTVSNLTVAVIYVPWASFLIYQGAPNKNAIHSSKAVGEPPFFLASSVFFAIKDAIIAARAEAGYNDWFPLDNPATPERIRMACTDEFTTRFVNSDFRPNLSV